MKLSLLKVPEHSSYYEFSADPSLVVFNAETRYLNYEEKSFYADICCFDSKPEKELFNQLVCFESTVEVYFTGMFTNDWSELSVLYIDQSPIEFVTIILFFI